MERPTCKTCAYFNPHGKMKSGACRRYPPRRSVDMKTSKFESTEGTWFCGEHPDFGEYIMSLKEPADAVCDVCGSHFVHGTELFCEQCERLVCEKCHKMVDKQLLCSLCIQRARS
jgi:hypothetical protein